MLLLSSGIAELHDVFGRQIAFDINHGSLAFTRVTEEDEAVVAIAQRCHHVIAAHHLAILHHLSDFFRSLAVGLQIVGYFRGMVLIYQALVYLAKEQHVLDVSISKSFLKDALTLEIKGNDLLYKCWDADLLYNQKMELLQVSKRGTRDLQLTLRYKFNTTRSKYKGTGAGNAELNRL